MSAPSGEQFELASGDQRAVVVEVGGGLRSYSAGGRDVLHGYAADEMCSSGRGQLLMPWPNRLEDGSYEFDGKRYQAPVNDPAENDAIHGLVRWAAWQAAEREPSRLVMRHVLHPQPGYPFTLELAVEYSLGERGLRVRTTATNAGGTACPFGSGAHPYLTLGTPTVDSLTLHVPARSVVLHDERGLPLEKDPVEGTELDFRGGRPIGATRLDNGFTDLDRDVDGRAWIELGGPEAQVGLWLDERHPYVMVFTGDLPDVGRRGVAVEPMTCPPNAFRSGDGLIRLEPGETFEGAWGIEPGRSTADSRA